MQARVHIGGVLCFARAARDWRKKQNDESDSRTPDDDV
jgi:hypothetical protein